MIDRKERTERIRTLCEGAACVALSVVLSFFKIDVGAQGGSINFTMVPLIVFVLRRGTLPGFCASFAFGVLKFLLGGEIIAWQSIVFDYLLAYAVMGFAFVARPIMKKRSDALAVSVRAVIGTLAACLARLAIHVISGATIYAEYMPDTFLDMEMSSPFVYSLLYNSLYMVPCTLATIVLTPILSVALSKALPVRSNR